MRVLFVIHTWKPEGRGGSETHADQLAQGLTRKGNQVGVFTRVWRPDRPPYEVTTATDGQIGITQINHGFDETPTFEWIYKNRWIHEALEREMDEFKPDLVHVHHLTGLSTTVVEAAKSRGLPVVMTLHDFWTVCPRGQRMTRDLELCEDVDRRKCLECLRGLWPHLLSGPDARKVIVDQRGGLSPAVLAEYDRHMSYILGLCDVLVCPSEFHRERMLDFPIDPEHVIALPHGLQRMPGPVRDRRGSTPRVIGYLGTVIPVKGVHVLLEAFRELGRPGLELRIHGEIRPHHDDRTYGDRLRRQAADLPGVTFLGAYQASDVPQILEDIDILVVPSLWYEAYCLTLREGLLAGVPVVASDLGAMREALDGERDGLLFEPGNAHDLAEKLARLIDDDALRTRYLDRQAAVKSMDDYVVELEAVYRDAARRARDRAPTLIVAPSSFPPDLGQPAAAVVPPASWAAPGGEETAARSSAPEPRGEPEPPVEAHARPEALVASARQQPVPGPGDGLLFRQPGERPPTTRRSVAGAGGAVRRIPVRAPSERDLRTWAPEERPPVKSIRIARREE